MENSTNVLDQNLAPPVRIQRRGLLPWWIKVFVWIFMVMGAIVPFGLVAGILGYPFEVALYGIKTYDPLSIAGLSLSTLFLLKGVASFGLWFEKDWAIMAAKGDAIIGICLCIVTMIVLPAIGSGGSFSFSFRLELLLLIPYLVKIIRIERAWKDGGLPMV